MTSRRFYKNNFGYAFKSGFGANVSTALIQFFIISILFVLIPSKFILSSSNIEGIKNLSFFLTGDMTVFYAPLIFGVVLSSVLTGIFTFSFISDKKRVNIYYSLGIKREKLFAARFLSGLLLLVCSVVIPIVYDFILNIYKFGKSKNLTGSFVFYLLGLLSLSLLSYSISAFVFTNVGTVFEGIFFSATFMILPEIFLDIANLFVKYLTFGTAYGQQKANKTISIVDSAANFNPLRYLINGLKSSAQADKKGYIVSSQYGERMTSQPELFKIASIKFVIMFLIISVAVFFVSLYLFKRRKTEIAGFIGKSKIFNFISTFIISLSTFGILFGILIKQYKFFDKYFAVVLISSVAFIVTYVVLSLIIYRSGKVFIKNLYNLAIQLLICFIMIAFFKTGFFGYMNKTPKIKNIDSVSISNDYKDYAFNVNSLGYGITNLFTAGGTLEKSGAVGDYKTENDLKKIVEIHKSLIENRKISKKTLIKDSDKLFPSAVEITYTLKNGKKIYRHYYGVTPEQRELMFSLEDSDYIKERLNNVFNKPYDKSLIDRAQEDRSKLNAEEKERLSFEKYKMYLQDNLYSVNSFDKCMNKTDVDLTDLERKELLNALYKDISSLSAKELYFPEKTLGMIKFTSSEKNANDNLHQNIKDKMYDDFDDFGKKKYAEIIVSEKMTNTLEFFKRIGVSTFTDEVKLPKEIKIIKPRSLDNKFYTYRGIHNGRSEVLSREYVYVDTEIVSNEKTENNEYSIYTDEKISDLQSIKNVMEHEQLFANISVDNGYILNYKNSDGNLVYAYVDGNKLTENIKAKAASIKQDKDF